ncbi:unnamed protein product, partial [Symbiodinium sp. CCMP2456]
AMEWSEAAVKGKNPPKRARHAAVYLPEQQKMLVFGGDGERTGYLNDLWILDTKDQKAREAWKQASNEHKVC